MHVDFMTGPEEVYWVIMESTFVNDRWIQSEQPEIDLMGNRKL